jgi:hypothetical protein
VGISSISLKIYPSPELDSAMSALMKEKGLNHFFILSAFSDETSGSFTREMCITTLDEDLEAIPQIVKYLESIPELQFKQINQDLPIYTFNCTFSRKQIAPLLQNFFGK